MTEQKYLYWSLPIYASTFVVAHYFAISVSSSFVGWFLWYVVGMAISLVIASYFFAQLVYWSKPSDSSSSKSREFVHNFVFRGGQWTPLAEKTKQKISQVLKYTSTQSNMALVNSKRKHVASQTSVASVEGTMGATRIAKKVCLEKKFPVNANLDKQSYDDLDEHILAGVIYGQSLKAFEVMKREEQRVEEEVTQKHYKDLVIHNPDKVRFNVFFFKKKKKEKANSHFIKFFFFFCTSINKILKNFFVD
ncbi:hypothetical protein RFI_05302 [Reticulomyxa filosa]|uniref:Uncharacterized protein n=1 Tax=Reticulomyxa filosa TaxID=46433 RepID=X6NZS7_RETFI|nr:hypothetical protein RFI_05302 [Reticulomyxa filosa]|eukprot:ETO31815.1 hypothetical protein RFI_05302 [Reticulomyxa filosa]